MSSVNQEFYDGLWSRAYLEDPEHFNTWPLVSSLAESPVRRLEVGPGLRPRFPIGGTHFVDFSRPALTRLKARGAHAVHGEIGALPFSDDRFDLVGAFDIIEHVADDIQAFREIRRVLRAGGTLIFSVPLYQRLWTRFDQAVGHFRRYEPDALEHVISGQGFVLEKSAAYGMQPKSRLLLEVAAWAMTRCHRRAMRWYNRVFMPIAIFLQKPLCFTPGLIRGADVDEVILVCRRLGR